MIVPETRDTTELEYDELATLKYLAHRTELTGDARVACADLAAEFDVSNQTASRRIRKLHQEGLIDRGRDGDGQSLALTPAGVDLLLQEFREYHAIFGNLSSVELSGTVSTGLGRGKGFVSLPGYMKQFKQRLGYEPFPGTLNVTLSPESIRKRVLLTVLDSIPIESWEDESGEYGAARCYPAAVENEDGVRYTEAHVIAPEQTDHDRKELEIIAPAELRAELDIEDGDQVTVHVTEN